MSCCLSREDGVATGGGDVVGPASSTDTAVALWDGTTGKLLMDSGVLVDASNNIVTPGRLGVAGGLITDGIGGATDVVIGDGTGNRGITVFSGATALGVLGFTDGANSFRAGLRFDHNTNRLEVIANGGQRGFWDAAGLHITAGIEIDGTLNHDGPNLGFRNQAPTGFPAAYTVTNFADTRVFDAAATTVDELADVMATMINDFITQGLFQGTVT